jgi:hypothetical protein
MIVTITGIKYENGKYYYTLVDSANVEVENENGNWFDEDSISGHPSN